MPRVSEKELRQAVEALNNFFKLPTNSWVDGKSQIGNIHLDFAYGKAQLVQTMNEHGGVTAITGFASKREILNYIYMLMKGGRLERELAGGE